MNIAVVGIDDTEIMKGIKDTLETLISAEVFTLEYIDYTDASVSDRLLDALVLNHKREDGLYLHKGIPLFDREVEYDKFKGLLDIIPAMDLIITHATDLLNATDNYKYIQGVNNFAMETDTPILCIRNTLAIEDKTELIVEVASILIVGGELMLGEIEKHINDSHDMNRIDTYTECVYNIDYDTYHRGEVLLCDNDLRYIVNDTEVIGYHNEDDYVNHNIDGHPVYPVMVHTSKADRCIQHYVDNASNVAGGLVVEIVESEEDEEDDISSSFEWIRVRI